MSDQCCCVAFDELYGHKLKALYEKRNKMDVRWLPNLFVLEGADGVGKTSISKKVFDILAKEGYTVNLIHEPGSTELGEELRKIILNRSKPLPTMVQFYLFSAARSSIIDLIASKPEEIFILDRYVESTIIYQYLVANIVNNLKRDYNFRDYRAIHSLLKVHMDEGIWPLPNGTFIIYRDREKAWKAANEEVNVFEKQGENYHKLISKGYNLFLTMGICDQNRSYYAVFNHGTVEDTADNIVEEIKHLISDRTCGICKKLIEYPEMYKEIPSIGGIAHKPCIDGIGGNND